LNAHFGPTTDRPTIRYAMLKRLLILASLFAVAAGGHAIGAEIKVLAAGAYRGVAAALAPAFEQQTGHKVVIDNGTAGQLVKRVNDGEAFDVLIVPPAGMKELAEAGKVRADTIANVARVGIGVAVREGAEVPKIATTDEFKQALLAAKKVAYIDPAAGGSSGIYLDKLYDKLGIGQEVRAKALLVPGGYVAERVTKGEADLGIHQISEILAVGGAVLVGPLPPEIQNYTVYAAAISTKAANADGARAFLEAMKTRDAAKALGSKGMEMPGP
jgi:molybdate transport system substrate-binding protein